MLNSLRHPVQAFKAWYHRWLLKGLVHTTRATEDGAKIMVLNTGAVITPEAEAMLQALHSRSAMGLMDHLKILAKKGAKAFMASFYVGYGHKSIGDCGSTTIFIEGVSMLCAKAIQDHPLYSGQESSTRYIPFDKQPFMNPYETIPGEMIQEGWRRFYTTSLPKVVRDLKARYPKQDHEKQKDYDKAIAARAFDIMRGFLPAGATTNLAWHTNLRQAADHLMRLRHHPLGEVRDVAGAIEDALKEAHPSSFGHKRYPETEGYIQGFMRNEYYLDSDTYPDFLGHHGCFQRSELQKYRHFLNSRPPKTELAREIEMCGVIEFMCTLDFGSFRDLQRHRAVHMRMPLLTSKHGFEGWYLIELPEDVRMEAYELLSAQKMDLEWLSHAVSGTDELNQYYLPMGYRVPVHLTGSLPSLVYLVELRTTRHVHPTLRRRTWQMARYLESHLSSFGLVLHLDPESDRFDVKRGTHDIELKA